VSEQVDSGPLTDEEFFRRTQRNSRLGGALHFSGLLFLLGTLVYSYLSLTNLETSIQEKTGKLAALEEQLEFARADIRAKTGKLAVLEEQLEIARSETLDVEATQREILEFLGKVLDGEPIRIFDAQVDWEGVQQQLGELRAGPAKSAIMNAILLSWKDIQFDLGGDALESGFDSSTFLLKVLRSVGVVIEVPEGVLPSTAIKQASCLVENAQPGDIAFFKGDIGSFGLLIAATSGSIGDVVGIGHLSTEYPLRITGVHNNPKTIYGFEGYYRPPYAGAFPSDAECD